MIQCKDNVRHHLTSIGVATKIRENILCCLFGADSLEMAGDEEAFDNRVAELMQYLRQQNIDAVDYIQNRIIPKIANNCKMKWAESWIGQQQWTNNNCESANHVLKMAVDWKPKRLTDLVDHAPSWPCPSPIQRPEKIFVWVGGIPTNPSLWETRRLAGDYIIYSCAFNDFREKYSTLLNKFKHTNNKIYKQV